MEINRTKPFLQFMFLLKPSHTVDGLLGPLASAEKLVRDEYLNSFVLNGSDEVKRFITLSML